MSCESFGTFLGWRKAIQPPATLDPLQLLSYSFCFSIESEGAFLECAIHLKLPGENFSRDTSGSNENVLVPVFLLHSKALQLLRIEDCLNNGGHLLVLSLFIVKSLLQSAVFNFSAFHLTKFARKAFSLPATHEQNRWKKKTRPNYSRKRHIYKGLNTDSHFK